MLWYGDGNPMYMVMRKNYHMTTEHIEILFNDYLNSFQTITIFYSCHDVTAFNATTLLH